MKLHEAIRKVIRHFGVNVIEEKRLMSFLADYKAFDDYPAVKEVMRAIATGDSGKKICLAADVSDEEFLRLASEIKEKLVSERSFKEEFARYAVDSVSFALGIVSSVTEPCDHGYEAVQKTNGSKGSSAQDSPSTIPAGTPRQSGFGTVWIVSGNTWQTASDGAESHRRFYRGKDLTSVFESGTFSENVANGTFRNIFPGDYIIKNVIIPDIKDPHGDEYCYDGYILKGGTYTIKFIIADLDVAMNQGYPKVASHHTVIVPETPPFEWYMNYEDIHYDRYAWSDMRTGIMPAFAIGLVSTFGRWHLLSFNLEESQPYDWQPCTCRLMTLSMVFGQTPPWWSNLSWSDFDKDSCLGGKQLAAFRLNPALRGKDMLYWVSDSCKDSKYYSMDFAYVIGDSNGIFTCAHHASADFVGVRPFALLR